VSEQSNLLRVGDTLLYLLNGTWRSVHRYFHGVPFILSGSAVALSRRYPAWLGWVGVAGGTASFSGRREGDRAALAVVGNGATVGLGGVYPNFPYQDLKNWARAYYGTNLERLVRTKKRYDPDSFFSFHQSLSGHVPEGAALDTSPSAL
jgi:FAD/FMN-containing dehydrogenase